jgi:hypothetical protein
MTTAGAVTRPHDRMRTSDEVNSNTERMMQMIYGFTVSQIVRSFAELDIADELSRGPKTAGQIALRQSANEDGVFRLLRSGIPLGLVEIDAQSRFSTTPLLRTLEQGVSGSLNGFARSFPSGGHWLPWGKLPEAIRTGEQQIVPTLGMALWEYFPEAPSERDAFTHALGELSTATAAQIARVIDTRSITVAADIGGGSGALVKALMAADPRLQGVVFDLPETISDASATTAQGELQGRLSFVAGDFFASVPPADLYLLRHILHDWDDQNCHRILTNCRRAMGPGSRVAVMEMVIAESDNAPQTFIQDLNMLVMFQAGERSLGQYETLFTDAGLRLVAVTIVRAPLGPTTIMEAVGV